MAKKKRKQKTNYEIYKTIRKTWEGFNPVTRIVEDKRRRNRDKEDKQEIRKFENF